MKNLKIGMRLGLGFALLLTLMALMSVIGIWRLNEIGAATRTMTEKTLVEERLASELVQVATINSVRTFALAKTSEPTLEKEYLVEISETQKQIAEIQGQLEKLVQGTKGRQLLTDIEEKRLAYQKERDAVLKLKADYEYSDARARVDSHLAPALRAYVGSITALKDHQKQLINQASTGIDEHFRTGRLLLIALGGLALALGALLAWTLTRSITQPLQHAVSLASQVAAGNLTSRIEVSGKDETAQLLKALQDMNASLADIVGRVRSGTDTIATASAEIAAGNMDLSSRTEEQASSLEETASSMEELTSTVKQNADNARQANQLAASASTVALQGGGVVAQVVETMGSINAILEKDRRHHRRHRRHRLPDQHPGVECGGGSGARRRTGTRIRGGGRRSAQPGATQRGRGQGNQDPDRRLGREGRMRHAAGGSGRRHHGRDRQQHPAGDRHHGGNHRRQRRTDLGHRTGQPGHLADGPGHATECGAGGTGGGGRHQHAGAGSDAVAGGRRIPGVGGRRGGFIAGPTRTRTGTGGAGCVHRPPRRPRRRAGKSFKQGQAPAANAGAVSRRISCRTSTGRPASAAPQRRRRRSARWCSDGRG